MRVINARSAEGSIHLKPGPGAGAGPRRIDTLVKIVNASELRRGGGPFRPSKIVKLERKKDDEDAL